MIQPKLLLVVVIVVSIPFAGCVAEQPESPSASPTTDRETALPPPDGGETRTATITRMVDGDTMEVEFEDSEEDTLRLLGVDTPETIASIEDPDRYDGIPDTTNGRDWLLQWGENAKGFAHDELAGEQIRVVTDPEGDTRGSFGRLLAYIYIDATNFNYKLIKQGYARRYDDPSFTYRETFGETEEEARTNNRGVWGFEQNTSATPTPELAVNDDYDCSDFDSQNEAQEFFDTHDPSDNPYRLDADGDSQACESLS